MKECQVSFEDKVKVLEASIKILNCDEKARLEMMRRFCIQEGINSSFLLPSILKRHDSDPQRPTELLKKFGSGITALKFYQKLEAKGYVEKTVVPYNNKNGRQEERNYWILVGFGLQYGKNIEPPHCKYLSAFFYEDTFGELLEFINA